MKNTENLIGKKVYGFKFENEKIMYIPMHMDLYIGKIGKIIKTYSDGACVIDFGEDYFAYPTDQVLNHLLECEEPVKEEIPTLNDGVLMLVSKDKVLWYSELVFGIKKGYFLAWDDLEYNSITFWKYAKPLPTKEEQLTAILGSSEKVAEIMELFKSE